MLNFPSGGGSSRAYPHLTVVPLSFRDFSRVPFSAKEISRKEEISPKTKISIKTKQKLAGDVTDQISFL